ncbi:MAG: hypothetical protein E6K80_10240 [Candidatus Eisenbacteria bacterium]|uniref:MobA-like NTP transferase domain-containing protein n=1 Tax=Eiseniibacteriota bacterium TaxID=2212470 RepID=A0A538U1X8_UNCEI|nr:MAG: hypothetical protein E6K80_10240 [Candidatus Eisenbacteria bacterium]
MRTRGVLVAGGLGRRLGLGVPKALVPLRGLPLAMHALRALFPVVSEIVIAAPAGMEIPPPTLAIPVRRVIDRGDGPLGGVVAACEGGGFEHAFVLGADLPFVSSLVPALLDALRSTRARAIVPAPGGRLQPGERSIVRAVERIPPTPWDDTRIDAAGGALALFNVNTLEDLREAERILDRRAIRS